MNLIVLDRDGVINELPERAAHAPEQWQPIPGSLEAVARLNRAGYRLVVASNEPAIGRGLMSPDALFLRHRGMQEQLAALGGGLDGLFFCPHRPEDGCRCRKPAGGLLEEIGRRLQVELEHVLVVGDEPEDLEAAVGVGAQPVLVRTGYGENTLAVLDEHADVPVYRDLNEFSLALLEGSRSE